MASTDTGLIENVVINNILIDTRIRCGNWWGNGEPICMFALWHHLDSYLDPAPDRKLPVNIRNIQMRGISCRGENLIGIIGKNENIQDITIDGLSYERLPSQNGCIKGINTVDIAPAREELPVLEDTPYYWLLLKGCKDVAIRNARIMPFEGQKLQAAVLECSNINIPE